MNHAEIHTVRPILAEEDTAIRVQRLVLEDLTETLELDTATAMQIANPDSESHVAAQLEKLRRSENGLASAAYFGAYLDGQLDGFMKIGPWTRYDQAMYGNAFTRAARRPLARLKPNYQRDRRGIHHLSASRELDETSRSYVIDHLVRKSLASRLPFSKYPSDSLEVNIPLMPSDNDPTKPVLVSYGFEPTGKKGAPVAGIPQELYRFFHLYTDEWYAEHKGFHPRDLDR